MQALKSFNCSRAVSCRRNAGVEFNRTVKTPLLSSRRALPVSRAQTKDSDTSTEAVTTEWVTGEYCTIDSKGKKIINRSIGEMEQDYLGALTSWYVEGKPTMSNEEFELLREELLWNGSKVAVMDKQELLFLEASLAYSKGQPIMSDEEYDQLKTDLKLAGSVVSAQGPRCSIRSQKMYSDAQLDYVKMTLLNIPAALVVLGSIFVVDYLSDFKITELLELPPPYGTLAVWALLLPTTFVLSTSITNVVLRDGVILKGACPNCGVDNFTYFGDIFTVSGNKGQNIVDCPGCNAGLTFDSNKRVVVVQETPDERAAKAAAAASKKKAAAKKKTSA